MRFVVALLVSMSTKCFDQLDSDEQVKLKKCATERLEARLVRAGLDEDTVFAYKHEQVIEAVASIMLCETGAVEASGAVAKPKCIWERKLELRARELELREAEKQLREQEMAEADKI